jgi:hypothetical protein
MLVEDAGLHPTRSHASRRRRDPSACSIVTAALKQVDLSDYLGGERRGAHLSERAVEGIWNRYRASPLIIHRGATDFARITTVGSSLIPAELLGTLSPPPC